MFPDMDIAIVESNPIITGIKRNFCMFITTSGILNIKWH